MPTRILVLEDDSIRVEQFRYFFRTGDFEITFTDKVSETIRELEHMRWDMLFLDHDLGNQCYCPSDENSGYAVALWLAEHEGARPDHIYLHSMNYVGRQNMKRALPMAIEMPFSYIADEVSNMMRKERH